MKVMKPRTGPAWANEPTVFVPPTPTQDTNGLSDLEWMKQRTSKNVDILEKAFQQSDDEGEHDEGGQDEGGQDEGRQDDTKETILQTSRLFVRNLAFSCTDEELADLFKPFGEITQVSFLSFFTGHFFSPGTFPR